MVKLFISYLILMSGFSWGFYTGIEEATDISGEQLFLANRMQNLLSKRSEEFHWGRQTWISLMSLSQLHKHNRTNTDWQLQTDTKLAIKQLDIELLLIMLRRAQTDEKEPNHSGFIHYIFTLTSFCRDPKNFYGYNLLDDLWNTADPSHFAYAYKAFAVCSANGPATKQNLKQLVDMLVKARSETYDPDTTVMILMAAVCFAENYPEYSQLKHLYHNRLQQLLRLQDDHGSINENIVSTSLAAQVLSSIPGYEANAALAKHWLKTEATRHDSFQELLCTAETILGFSGRGRLDINIRSCSTGATIPDPYEQPVTTFTYIVWYDLAGDEKRHVQLSVPAGTTMFEAMQRAAQTDDSFEFRFENSSLGHMVTSIGNQSQNPEKSLYWMLYVDLPHMPTSSGDPEKKYAQYAAKTGVDSTVPKQGAYILFWLRHVDV